MAKQKQNLTPPTPAVITSYAVMTADSVLKELGIALSKLEIQQQLNNPQSFYKYLLNIPAISIHNRFMLSHCYNTQDYNQGEIVNILYVKLSRQSAETTPLQAPSEFSMRVDTLRDQSENQAQSLHEINKQQKDLDSQLQDFLKKYAQAWRELQQGHAKMILDKLSEQGIELSPEHKMSLTKHLDQQSADVQLSPEIIKSLKLKQEPDATAKAVISVLLERVQHGQPS